MGEVLSGRIALVTGAGRGIGRGIAVEFAREGAKVVVASRSPGPIAETIREIEAFGGTAVPVQCDIADKQTILDTVAKTIEAFGGLDILVNCAQGFGTPDKPTPGPMNCPVDTFNDDEWDYTFLTGPTASYRFMKAAYPYLKASGRGRVINFCSNMGLMGSAGVCAYSAAKEAVRGLSRTAARDWGKFGITVNLINPVIATDSFKATGEADPESMAAAMAMIPLGRPGDIYADGGRVAVFIAGPDAAFITGHTFDVDGGLFLRP